jgi:hypothetical protein
MSFSDESNMVLPVQPMNGGGFGNGWGDGAWLWIILLFALGGWGNGFGGGFGGGYDFPWLLNGQNAINANTNAGFDHAATQSAISALQNSVTTGFGDVQLGIAGVNQNICQTGNGIVNALNNGFNTAEVSNNARQIANMQQAFNAQTATMQGFNAVQGQLAQCCCDNKSAIKDVQYAVATENCADRTQAMQNTRDIIDSQTRSTQAILDKLCQLELDGKNDRIRELESQLNEANRNASQTAQNAFIAQGFASEVDQLYNRLNSCPVPTTPVYGRTPIFTCNNGGYNVGCGCGM